MVFNIFQGDLTMGFLSGMTVFAVISILVILIFLTSRYRKIRHEGEALIINQIASTKASLTGAFVWPVIHRFEYMDITRKKISIVRSGRKDAIGDEYEGLHCMDDIRADLKVDFYIGVNHEQEDIVRVAKLFTTAGASDLDKLKEHFQPKFSEALKTAVKQFEFAELLTNRRKFRDAVVEVIGSEMDGFKIYDVVIDSVEQTAFEAHDPQNVLDVEGIRKIAKITSEKNIMTNAIRQDEMTQTKQKNVEAETNRLQLSKQEAEAQARTKREIEVIQAQESALTEEKRQQYLQQTELARLGTEEEVGKRTKTMEMEIELTRIGTERQMAISQEEVNRAKGTERVRTEKEIAEQEMAKDASVEEAKKAVVEKRAQIVEIERKIAKEEEATKNLRAFETANRDKTVKVTQAQAVAESLVVEQVESARADKEAMREESEKMLLENDAQMKIKAREADNYLIVKTREAEAIERMAVANQEEIRKTGMAHIEVEQAQASVIEMTGNAEANAIRAKGLAEAQAQTARFEAAQKYDVTTREHDKWVMKINLDKEVQLTSINAHKEVALENGKILGTALSNAEIKLFGGEGMREIRTAVMDAAGIDAKFNNSRVLNPLVQDYIDDKRDMIDDLKDVLQNSKYDTSDLNNLSSANLMNKLAAANPTQLVALKNVFGIDGKDKQE